MIFYVPNIYIIHLYISEYCHLSLMETAHSQWLCVTVGGLEPLLRTWRQCLDWNLNCLTSMKIHSSILNEKLNEVLNWSRLWTKYEHSFLNFQ